MAGSRRNLAIWSRATPSMLVKLPITIISVPVGLTSRALTPTGADFQPLVDVQEWCPAS